MLLQGPPSFNPRRASITFAVRSAAPRFKIDFPTKLPRQRLLAAKAILTPWGPAAPLPLAHLSPPSTILAVLPRVQSLIPHAAQLTPPLGPSSGLGLLPRGPSPTLASASEIPGLRHAVSSLLFAVRWVLAPLESDACCFCVRLNLLACC